MRPITIAIDGTSASGKGTIAKRIAAAFGFAHLDTGALYRAVALAMQQSKLDPKDAAAAAAAAKNLDAAAIERLMADPALRSGRIGSLASVVAQHPGVRAALLAFQQNFCRHPPGGRPGAVLDGRDIGTIIAPDAGVKLFVNASPETRAKRRFKELQARGENVTEAAVLADLAARDRNDGARNQAAMQAPGTVVIDTTNLGVEEAVETALRIVKQKLG